HADRAVQALENHGNEPAIAIAPQHRLANLGVPARNRFRETLEMGAGESSVPCTFNSHSHRGNFIAGSRPLVRITRSLLGRDRYARSDAVNSGRDTIDFG